jgi:hypothetical protein
MLPQKQPLRHPHLHQGNYFMFVGCAIMLIIYKTGSKSVRGWSPFPKMHSRMSLKR